MKILKEYWVQNRMYKSPTYCICFQVADDNGKVLYKFKDMRQFYEADTEYLDINKFNDTKFLDENKIDYILEGKEDKNIIPIGIVDFTKTIEYYSGELYVMNFDGVDLHKSNQIMKNIERAIEIKYEAVKFLQKFTGDKSRKEELEY